VFLAYARNFAARYAFRRKSRDITGVKLLVRRPVLEQMRSLGILLDCAVLPVGEQLPERTSEIPERGEARLAATFHAVGMILISF
jgi:hypothetical protein